MLYLQRPVAVLQSSVWTTHCEVKASKRGVVVTGQYNPGSAYEHVNAESAGRLSDTVAQWSYAFRCPAACACTGQGILCAKDRRSEGLWQRLDT